MEELFLELGLSPSETKIYLALIRYGEMKISEILDKSKLNSGRIYDILGNLVKKGFISKTEKNGVKHFAAAPPSILKDLIDGKKQKVEEQDKLIDSKMPELMKLYSSHKEEFDVEVFVGKRGARTAYEMLFQNANNGDELFVIGVSKQEKYAKWVPLFLKTYVYPERKRLSLKTRKIMNIDAKKEEIWSLDKSRIKYLPWNILSSYEICNDVVILQIFQGETIHLVIRHKQTANDFREQFELLWKIAKN